MKKILKKIKINIELDDLYDWDSDTWFRKYNDHEFFAKDSKIFHDYYEIDDQNKLVYFIKTQEKINQLFIPKKFTIDVTRITKLKKILNNENN